MFVDARVFDYSSNQYTFDELKEQLKTYDQNGYNFYIGSDSQVFLDKICLVTCICAYKPGTGSKVFYTKENHETQTYKTLRARVLLETYKSLETALEIDECIKSPIEIHLDIGTTKRSKTAVYYSELVSMVISQGYTCEVKPNSWAAYLADRKTKTFSASFNLDNK